MKKKKVNITWFSKPLEVNAYCELGLAVHKIPSDDKKVTWTISHIPTGLSICGMFAPFNTMREAKAFALKLLQCDNWDITGSSFNYVPTEQFSRVKELFNIVYQTWRTWNWRG